MALFIGNSRYKVGMGIPYKVCFGRTYSEGLLYSLNDDEQSYTVAGIGVCSDTTILIPATYKGLPVTHIGDSAFYGCINIQKVVLRNSITTIGQTAFYHCASLIEITIPESITHICSGAFADCTSLECVNYKGSLEQWCNITFEDSTSNPISCISVFYINGEPVTALNIPANVSEIKPYAFYGCSAITSVSIPNSVSYIGPFAFLDCNNLTSATFQLKEGCVWTTYSDAEKNDNVGRISSTSISNSSTAAAYLTSTYFTLHWFFEEVPPASLAFTSNGDGTCSVSNITTYDDLVVDIPSVSPNGDMITSIGANAFKDNINIISVNIPNSITSFGESAFYGCTSLTSITIPDSVTSIGASTFRNCSGLTSIIIPDSITYIGAYAFENCSNLTSVTLEPKDGWIWTTYSNAAGTTGAYKLSATSLSSTSTAATYLKSTYASKYWIFAEAPATSLAFTSNGNGTCYVSGMGTYEDNSIEIPNISPDGDTVTGIGTDAFKNKTAITGVIIPDSVTTIDASAFAGCSSLATISVSSSNTSYKAESNVLYSKDGTILVLYPAAKTATSFTLPNAVTTIGDYAFYANKKLSSISTNTSRSLNCIGNYAFYNSTSITQLPTPKTGGYSSIGNYAFYQCSKLKPASSWPSITTIGDYAFYKCTSIQGDIYNITGLQTIGNYAFSGCTGLTSVTIRRGVTSVGDYAFSSCTGVTSISIASTNDGSSTSSTYVGQYAFAGCSNATSLVVGYYLMRIRPYAFQNCTKLSTVTWERKCSWAIRGSETAVSAILSFSTNVLDSKLQTYTAYLTTTYVNRYFMCLG